MSLPPFFKRWFNLRKREAIDRYHIATVTSAAELLLAEDLPLEIRFVLVKKPERMEAFRKLLEAGYGIGIRTVNHTPEAVLTAVDQISHLTQENTIIPWLPRLLREGEVPTFTQEDLVRSERHGAALYELARTILERRYEFKKFVLIDLNNRGLAEGERVLMNELNEDLYPFAIDYIVNRILFDNAHTRTEVAQNIIKALLIIGPIAHFLEHWVRGIGKLFAASADDLLSETAELFALRGSGFTWRQLARRSIILVPVFALATWGAFSVEGLVEANRLVLAGLIFGLSAVALSLTTALQSIRLYLQAYQKLERVGKLPTTHPESLWKLALRQDFTNPARIGLFLGASASPVISACVFLFFPYLVHNGWVLALLGSVEGVVAGATVVTAVRLNRWFFRRRILGEMERLASGREA